MEVPIDRIRGLLIAEETLRRLHDGGVDNWEWYGESLNGDEDLVQMWQFKEKIMSSTEDELQRLI